jgi:L-asparaginase
LTNAELLARVPEAEDIVDVIEVPFRALPSHALSDTDLLELAAVVRDIFASDRADGVVITHGTNTLEETAYFLHLVLKTNLPVVLVGAMRPASSISTDSDLNLLNALMVAGAEESADKGVLVTLNDTIHSARDVTKTATYRLQSFESSDTGPLGFADVDRRVVYYHAPARPHTFATPFDVVGLGSLPRVDVVLSYVGAEGGVIDALTDRGVQGIVCAGTGAGRPTPAQEDALDRAVARGIVVCIASRVGSGRVARSPGMRRRGFVASDNLQPWKARILLALALTRTGDPEEVQAMFDRF